MLRNITERRLLLVLAVVGFWLFVVPLSRAQKSAQFESAPTALSTAKVQIHKGDLESGEKTLWSILSVEPTNEQALLLLAVVRARQQRYAEEAALFRHVLQLDPKSIVASRGLAEALLAQDKPDEAIRQYKETIQLVPQDSRLKVEVAGLDLSRGNFADALATL